MPRSPSRDRSDRFAGRRGYFRRLDGVGRAKVLLAAVAAAGAVAWAAADAVFPRAITQAAHTHGELADPHATLSDRCEACHQTFTGGKVSPFEADHRWRAWDCQRCHTGSAHHAPAGSVDEAAHNDCGSCHHDHQGKQNRLTRLGDSHCTGCHKDLSTHPPTTPNGTLTRVSNFATGHPEFRPLTTPPERTLKFSHALHLTPGLHREGESGAALKKDGGVLQLDCKACHEPYVGGKHFKAVNFEANCRSCHPLAAPPGNVASGAVAGFPVPHGKKWADTAEAVRAGYLNELVRDDRKPLFAPVGPGGRTEAEREKQAELLRGEVDRLSGTAEKLLRSSEGCVKCHDTTGDEVKPLHKGVWLPKAEFDHAAHKTQTCASCHPGTAGKEVPRATLVEKEEVTKNILGADSCRKCHAPKSATGGGVRHGCTDCHSYHHRK